ncbi:MAG: 50S ribosomal protein L29 [Candidatus Magasanikbacteria bacterium CG_4_10_14_0_8_um_filter_32_14]|uniref:Large ribosomal subunit protein uL29 n=2 Tax=Candidatus Magasanikiibacteriota TaxID=1752731 RepID=A0A2M7R9B6_9BACT|nr:MAG: 50S ribosomal protein L29 [Candidatus Magasanikbacteria bacterium CG1_02_32_51]PIY93157.1 MAG: 50S ribosomal protein L29 [Candidatus Magasanikbacteria bacterium CG_4_10_14_0_8_um_filter_32_14]
MDYKELKIKSLGALEELLAEKRDLLRSLRFQASENQLKKVSSIRKEKKNVSRIMTAIKNLQNTVNKDDNNKTE